MRIPQRGVNVLVSQGNVIVPTYIVSSASPGDPSIVLSLLMSKRPRPFCQVDDPSSSGGGTDNSRDGDSDFDPKTSPPKKKANVQSTIRTSQKLELGTLDGACCLIIGETDGQCLEVCHILRRREHEENVGTDGQALPSLLI